MVRKIKKNKIFWQKLLAGLLLMILACNQNCRTDQKSMNKDDGNYLGVIHLDNAYKKNIPSRKLSSIARSVKYIELEDEVTSLLIHPSIISDYDSTILIKDNSSCLYKFDKRGKLIWKIDKKGKGPGEYVQIYGVCVDDDNKLYILDNNQRKIVSYGCLRGGFINEIDIPLSSGSFALNNQGFVLWNPPWSFINQDKCYFLTFIDKNGNILHQIERRGNDNNFRGGLLTSAAFYRLGGDLYIKDTYNDTVYKIDSDYSLAVHAVISSGKYKITRRISEDVFLREKYKNDYISQLLFLESERYIFFSFYIGNFYLVVYDKRSGSFVNKISGKNNDYAAFENDMDKGPPFAPIFIDGNRLYSIIPPSVFLEYRSSDERISEICNHINENSNPVVMIVELKD
jgi:hypothetical protein